MPVDVPVFVVKQYLLVHYRFAQLRVMPPFVKVNPHNFVRQQVLRLIYGVPARSPIVFQSTPQERML
jgi:hypothetical protein